MLQTTTINTILCGHVSLTIPWDDFVLHNIKIKLKLITNKLVNNNLLLSITSFYVEILVLPYLMMIWFYGLS